MKILNPDYYNVDPPDTDGGYCSDCDTQLEWSQGDYAWVCPECDREDDDE